MPRRQRSCRPPPRLWLVTDERQGERLWPAIAALPRGSGIVFRHHADPARRATFARVRRIARARRLTLLLAGPAELARAWGADGRYGAGGGRTLPMLTAITAHEAREMRTRARLVFLSPLFATRSHPGRRALGQVRFAALVRLATAPVIALGGMTRRNAAAARRAGAYGWAAIDGLTPGMRDQKRKAVPR